MHLCLVEIKNFRSFETLRVELQSGLNVLVGRNNTGKANLLQAIRHAVGPSASRGDALWLDRDDFYRSSSADTTERTITITLTFSELSDEQREYFYEIVDFDLEDVSQSKATIRFEASWPKGKRQASIKRTGGPATAEPHEVTTNLLQSLPITFLPALRDAEDCLAPGYRSRLASPLRDIATRKGGTIEEDIKAIYATANKALEKHTLIGETKLSLQTTTMNLAGSDYSASAIKAADVDFDKILRSLQILMSDCPVGALTANGLGYNNLLYMAVVLEHLQSPDPNECPIFLVEEPEAHLHPQLTMLLADYLANKTPGAKTPQTIVTTHSPTLAANIPPSQLSVLFADIAGNALRCNSLANVGMTDKERGALQRMMDITRATLYFARAIILVEGISEAVLIPALAKRIGHDLAKLHITVVPICGVAFETLKKMLNPSAFGIPVAIVTDADPPVTRGTSWNEDVPQKEGSAFKLSDRTNKLITSFSDHKTVKVFHSQITLEYDLAQAGDGNAAVMARAWEECFDGTPQTFNLTKVTDAGNNCNDKAILTWRGICRADHTGSKAEFAHVLAGTLEEKRDDGQWKETFDIPKYLTNAINHVVVSSNPPTNASVTGEQ
jgi:putative ATP-dependent endonuclease of the OLD family